MTTLQPPKQECHIAYIKASPHHRPTGKYTKKEPSIGITAMAFEFESSTQKSPFYRHMAYQKILELNWVARAPIPSPPITIVRISTSAVVAHSSTTAAPGRGTPNAMTSSTSATSTYPMT